MEFFGNTVNNEDILVFSGILFIFVVFYLFLINLGKKVIYLITFIIYLLVLNAFIFSLETNFIYFSIALSFLLFLLFTQIPIENKEIKKEETDENKEELTYETFVFGTPIALFLLYIVFLPISYVASAVGNSDPLTTSTASASPPSKAEYTEAEYTYVKAGFILINCSQMSNYDLKQNYWICKSATNYIAANKYKYGF